MRPLGTPARPCRHMANPVSSALMARPAISITGASKPIAVNITTLLNYPIFTSRKPLTPLNLNPTPALAPAHLLTCSPAHSPAPALAPDPTPDGLWTSLGFGFCFL